MTDATPSYTLLRTDRFVQRHIGPRREDIGAMLAVLGYDSLDAFTDAVVPENIRLRQPLDLPPNRSEREVLQALRGIASQNRLCRYYIGMGYYGTFTPQVIQRNILENPGWYTAYTPYQAEISQGRLEALLNFQTMVADLTGLPIANASLLDEATAAAEAMNLTFAVSKATGAPVYLVDDGCHPQTIAVVKTRAGARGIEVRVGPAEQMVFGPGVIGCLVQYPATDGGIRDFRPLCERAHAAGALVTAATDLLALTMLTPPGEWGADIAVGNSQRFGVPMGYGGPHAAFFSTRDEFKRHMPGRIIGVSKDTSGRLALRMALQTREQHIRRDKATSNVCTAQVLLAVMASMYAVYHGPEGLRRIAERVHTQATLFAAALRRLQVSRRPPALLRYGVRRGPLRQPAAGFSMLPGPARSISGCSTITTSRLPSTRRSRWPTSPTSSRSFPSTSPCPTCWATAGPTPSRPSPSRCAGPRRTSPIRSSIAATPRPRCCATSSGSRRRISRSPRR